MIVDVIYSTLIWLLIDVTIKTTLLLALVALAARLLARHRPVWRGLLWSSALAALFLLPVISLLLPGLQVPLWSSVQGDLQSLAFSGPLAPATGPPAGPSRPIGFLIASALYLAGLFIALARMGAGWWQVDRLRWEVCTFGDAADMARLQRWRVRLGVHAPVDLGFSDQISVPTVVGVWQPLILIPVAMAARRTSAALDGILVHELAHIKRRDAQWNLIGVIVAALYWYHPLVHLARRRLAEAREEACDDWAVEALGDATTYATTLLDVTARMDRRLAVALGLDMARTAHVLDRADRIITLGGRVMPRTSRLTAAATIVTVLIAAAVLGSLHPIQADPGIGSAGGSEPQQLSPIIQNQAPPVVRMPSRVNTIGQEQTLPTPQESVTFDEPPTPISLPAPIYPEMAKKAGVEGMVILHILIDTTGKVRDVIVLKGANPDLDRAAIEAARQSTWTPAFQNHKPVAVWVSFPVQFRLR